MVFAYTQRSTDPCVPVFQPVFQEWYTDVPWHGMEMPLWQTTSTRKYLTALKGNVSWLQILVASPSTPYFGDKREGRRISTSLHFHIFDDTKPRQKKKNCTTSFQVADLSPIYIHFRKEAEKQIIQAGTHKYCGDSTGLVQAACNELTPYLFIMEITGTKLGRRSRHAAKLRWHHIYVGCLELVEEWPPERPL